MLQLEFDAMVDECNSLQDKIDVLTKLLDTDEGKIRKDFELMSLQLTYMVDYHKVLVERINMFKMMVCWNETGLNY